MSVSPITYVQHLRIETAKRKLEQTEAPVDEIGWSLGYEDPAFIRRLFKRIADITPRSVFGIGCDLDVTQGLRMAYVYELSASGQNRTSATLRKLVRCAVHSGH